MSSAGGMVVERTLTVGKRWIIRPNVISKGDSSGESPGAALIAV